MIMFILSLEHLCQIRKILNIFDPIQNSKFELVGNTVYSYQPWNILSQFCNNTISYTSHDWCPISSNSNKPIFPVVYSNIFETIHNTSKDTICVRLLYPLYRCILIYSQAIFKSSYKYNFFLNNTKVNCLVRHAREEKRLPGWIWLCKSFFITVEIDWINSLHRWSFR